MAPFDSVKQCCSSRNAELNSTEQYNLMLGQEYYNVVLEGSVNVPSSWPEKTTVDCQQQRHSAQSLVTQLSDRAVSANRVATVIGPAEGLRQSDWSCWEPGLRSHCLQPNCLRGVNVTGGNLTTYTHMQIASTEQYIYIYFDNRQSFPVHQFT